MQTVCRSKFTGLFGLLAILALTLPMHSAAAQPGGGEPKAFPTLIAEQAIIEPGQAFTVAVHFAIVDPYHLYWTNPEGVGYEPSVAWDLPQGYEVSEPRWPAPQTFLFGGLMQFGYEHEMSLLFDITVPSSAAPGSTAELKANVQWLVCGEGFCRPGDAAVSLTLPVSADGGGNPSGQAQAIEQAERKVPRPAEGWSVIAMQSADGVTLQITAPSEEAAESIQGLRFFHDELYAFNPEVPQTTEVAGRNIRLQLQERTLDPNSYTGEPYVRVNPMTRVSGVLVSESGFGDASHIAIPVDVELTDTRPDSVRQTSDETSSTTSGGATGDAQAGSAAPQAGDKPIGFALAVGMALIGGVILNLMPCVFPVLSIKILGFVNQAGENPAIVRRHGYAFGIGVMLSFWVLVLVLLGLRAAAEAAAGGEASSVSWGFQLQNPAFVLAMIVLVFLIGLNLIGTFEVGIGLSAAAGKASQTVKKDGYGKSLFTGVLATLIATPCTGPFMAPAIGAALKMPYAQAFLVFSALGVGMAAPYVILSCFPKLLNYLPRPGAWMESFKQAMAFPMFATAGWLAWGYVQATSENMVVWLLIGMTIVAMGMWIYGRWATPIRTPRTKWIARAIALIAVVGGVYMIQDKAHAIEQARIDAQLAREAGEYVYEWLEYSPEAVAELRESGRPVVVDFTAWWCQICQVNKKTTLRTNSAQSLYEQNDVILIEADYGQRDPVIGRVLAEYDRGGVPLYLVFPADGGEPEILPETLTPSILQDAIERAVAN